MNEEENHLIRLVMARGHIVAKVLWVYEFMALFGSEMKQVDISTLLSQLAVEQRLNIENQVETTGLT